MKFPHRFRRIFRNPLWIGDIEPRLFDQLTAAQERTMLRDVRRLFSRQGMTALIDGTSVVLTPASGEELRLDLDILANAIALDGENPDIYNHVDRFVRAVLFVDDIEHMDTQGTYESLRLILVAQPADEDTEVGRMLAKSTLRPFGKDMATCLAYAGHDVISPAPVDRLERIDDLSTIEHAALVNLREHLLLSDIRITFHGADGGDEPPGCWVLSSDDACLSGTPLVMEDFLATRMPQINPDEGVLFAVPRPGYLLLNEVGHGPELISTLHVLAAGAAGLADSDEEFAISPRIHLWKDGMVETISELSEDGYVIEPNGYLMTRLSE